MVLLTLFEDITKSSTLSNTSENNIFKNELNANIKESPERSVNKIFEYS